MSDALSACAYVKIETTLCIVHALSSQGVLSESSKVNCRASSRESSTGVDALVSVFVGYLFTRFKDGERMQASSNFIRTSRAAPFQITPVSLGTTEKITTWEMGTDGHRNTRKQSISHLLLMIAQA